MKNHFKRNRLAMALSVIFAPALALGATKVVTTCADGGSGSLRDAIANAANNDVITFNGAAVACGTINLSSGTLEVDVDHLTIQGPSASPIAIDAGSKARKSHRRARQVRGFGFSRSAVGRMHCHRRRSHPGKFDRDGMLDNERPRLGRGWRRVRLHLAHEKQRDNAQWRVCHEPARKHRPTFFQWRRRLD